MKINKGDKAQVIPHQSKMTTEIFPRLDEATIKSIERDNQQSEQQWLLQNIKEQQIPQIKETLVKCLDIITSIDDIKLPISSARTEQIKGTITRNSLEFVQLDLYIQLRSVTKKRLHLTLSKPFEIIQLREILTTINNIISQVHLLSEYTDPLEFSAHLTRVVQELKRCNSLLNKPMEEYLFPKSKLKLSDQFNITNDNTDINRADYYKERLAVEMFLLNGEISMEVKSLYKITEQPWGEVKQGKSYIDKLREDMKSKKVNYNDIIDQERSLTHVFGLTKFTHHDYFARGVTYGDIVVIEVEKILINCQDPNLLSISAKLKGLENLVGKLSSNLDLALI